MNYVLRKFTCLPLMLAALLPLAPMAHGQSLVAQRPVKAQQSAIGELEKELGRVRGKPDAEAKALYALGKALAEERRFEEAEQYLKQALELDRKVGKPSDIFEDMLSIALVQGFAKKFDQAEATYSLALNEATAAKNEKWTVKLSNALGVMCIHSGQFEKAEKLYCQVRDVASGSADYVGEAQARLNLALIYKHLGEIKKGIAEIEAAQKLLGEEPDDQLLAGQISLNMASMKEYAGDCEGAFVDYKKAVEFFSAAGDQEREASASLALGNELLFRGQAQEAAQYFQAACEIYQGGETPVQLIMAKLRLGAALADQGKYQEAQRLHSEGAKLALEAGDNNNYIAALYEGAYDQYLAGNADRALSKFIDLGHKLQGGFGQKVKDKDAMADCLNGTALCCRALGQSEAAIQYYQQASQAYLRSGNALAQVSAENSIGCVYLDAHLTSQYLNQYKKVASLLSALSPSLKFGREYRKLSGSVGFNYAQSEVMAGHYDQALTAYEAALKDFNLAGDRKLEVRALIGLGLCKQMQGIQAKSNEDLKAALAYYQKAEPLAVSLALAEGQWDCAIGQGACLRRLGDNDGAEKYLRKAIALFEKEKGQYSRDDSKTFTLDLRSSSFEELIGLLMDGKRFDDGLEIVERGRARAFLDLLEGRRQNVFGRNAVAMITGGDGLLPSLNS